MAFKQQLAYTLIICKRLIYRLRTLAESQSLFPDFLAHDPVPSVSPEKGHIR
jgi:hypothetical protein